jgi:hypothetical protein
MPVPLEELVGIRVEEGLCRLQVRPTDLQHLLRPVLAGMETEEVAIGCFPHPCPDRLVANICENQFWNVVAISPAVEDMSAVFEVVWDGDVGPFGNKQCF